MQRQRFCNQSLNLNRLKNMKSNSISSAPVQTHRSRLALKTPRNVLSHTQPDFAQPWNMWERPLTVGTNCHEVAAAFVRPNLGGGGGENGEEPLGVQDHFSAVRQDYTCRGISGERSQLDNHRIVPAVNGFLGPGQFLPHPVRGSTLVHILCRRLCFLFQFRSLWSFHVLLMPLWVFFSFLFVLLVLRL